jgi:hypothetical protein
MDANFHTALAAYGVGLITHIGLVNGSGVELSGGSYARKTVTWSGAAGVRSPNADIVFDVPAGATVAGWRGYTALTSTPFTNAGTYTLQAASTNITVQAGA